MDWLAQLVPTIATCLGGPLAGMATGLIAKVLGIDESKVQETINSGKLTGEQVAALQQAELELKKQAQSMNLDFEKLATEDKKSARDMQIATKSIVPPTLAFTVTIGFFGILGALMAGYAQDSKELLIMLGSLSTAWAGVIAFYFGSSNGSQHKDEMLYNSTPVQK
jgi:hypothetical protein